MKKNFIIAIDGPSASGKGTLAKKIAAHFKLDYLNTGALYRLVAFRVIEQTLRQAQGDVMLSLSNHDLTEVEISELTKNISESDLENEKLFGEDVGAVASIIAKNKKLRAALSQFQHNFVANGKENGGCVIEGRDTTTVICPDADYKFFVTADVEIRAQRRFSQLKNQGQNVTFDEILAQLKKRDENDLNRADSPLKIAADAVVVDNGKLSIEEGFLKILSSINQ